MRASNDVPWHGATASACTYVPLQHQRRARGGFDSDGRIPRLRTYVPRTTRFCGSSAARPRAKQRTNPTKIFSCVITKMKRVCSSSIITRHYCLWLRELLSEMLPTQHFAFCLALGCCRNLCNQFHFSATLVPRPVLFERSAPASCGKGSICTAV